jgi:hypothetical protein
MKWSKKIVTITSFAVLTSGLYACQRGDSTLQAGKTTPARPGAEGAGVEGAVYLPAKTTNVPMATPMEAGANVIFGDSTTGLETILMHFRCTTDALKAVQMMSSEPAFWIEPQSQIIARQNKSVQTPDGKQAQELEDFVSFVCKTAPPKSARRAAKPGTRPGSQSGKENFSMFNAAAANAASEDEAMYDAELTEQGLETDATTASETATGNPAPAVVPPASTSPVTAGPTVLPANFKAVALVPGKGATLNVYHTKSQTAPLAIKVVCLEKEKMASADQKFAPTDPKVEVPDFVIATGFKGVVQTKLKDATAGQYQLVTCAEEAKKPEAAKGQTTK